MGEHPHRHRHKNISRDKKVLLSLLALPILVGGTGFALGAVWLSSRTPVLAQDVRVSRPNPVDLRISQYSDDHITIHAIDTDPEFQHITFGANNVSPLTLPNSQTANVVDVFGTGPQEYGTWIWTPLMQMTDEYMDSIISGASINGINVIYLSIDSYLDVYTLPEKTPAQISEKDTQIKAYSAKLEDFVKKAKQKGIAVDAEAGWRNWAEDGNTYKAFAVVNFVQEFNQSQKYILRGFQYDVEPYLLSSYKKDKAAVLTNFLNLIQETAAFLGSSKLKFTVVIPDFYNNDAFTPTFLYNGTTDYAYNHLLDVLQQRPGSSIIIMSYRNFAQGSDGTIDISRDEVETAENGMYATRVIIAQETGDVEPPYITFNNTTKKYYNDQVEKINNAFGYYSNFGGIAVHYVNAYLDLK